MKFRAAIALFALCLPAFAQHGGAHGGSIGSRGFSGHSGFSGGAGFAQHGFAQRGSQASSGFAQRGYAQPGFARPGFGHYGNFAHPAAPVRYGAFGSARVRGMVPSNFAGRAGMSARSGYGSMGPAHSRNGDRGRDRDRFEARRRSFANWYANLYPGWLGYGYPYVLDPGFYDWSDQDNSAGDQSGAAASTTGPYQDYGSGDAGANPQENFQEEVPPAHAHYGSRVAAEPAGPFAPASGQPLTVVFKSGRAAVKMQNYMMTARVLTDLDSQHYEQIPMDQIDVAATQRINGSAGVGFSVPGATRD